MTNYTQNLNLIKRFSEVLYKNVQVDHPVEEYSIIETTDKYNPIIENSVAKCFLHSVYNLKREISKMYEMVSSDTEVLIIYGIGSGDSLYKLKERFSHLQRLILIEPNQDVFKLFLKKHKLNDLLSMIGEVSFIVNQSTSETISLLSSIILEIGSAKVDVAYMFSYRTLYKEYFDKIHVSLVNSMRISLVNFATIHQYKYLWLANMFRNFNIKVLSSNLIEPLFRGKPVILVSAGPSLNKNMHLLKEVRNKAFIIAVGSAIKILDSNGIRPHFRFAIDGSPGQKMLFDQLTETDVPLISSAMHAHEVQDNYQGKIFRIILNSDFLMQYANSIIEESYLTYETGFSVANVALNFLTKNNCSKIIFIGQDLSFTGGEMYAKGSWKNDKYEDFTSSNFIKINDIFGNEIFTDRQHYNMKTTIENVILQRKHDIQFIDATEGGAVIENTTIKTFRSVIDDDLKDSNIEDSINIINNLKYDYVKDYVSIVNQISTCNMQLKQLLDDIIERLLSMKTSNKSNLKLNNTIKDIDYKYQSVLKNDYYVRLVEKYIAQELFVINRKYRVSKCNEFNGDNIDQLLEVISSILQFVEVIENLVKEFSGEQTFTLIFE